MNQSRKLLQVNTTLNEKEEKRFEEFFTRFSRSSQILTFNELLMLAFDRSIIHNKLSFSILHDFFIDALEHSSNTNTSSNERGLTKHQFNFFLSQLSYFIYHNDKHHLDKLLTEILAEKTLITRDSTIETVRNIIYDETNKKILNENVIQALCEYELELKNIYTIYMHDNLAKNYIMLKWYEIAIQNAKMNSQALIRFLRDADILPNILSVEQFEEIMMKMVPPVNNREHEFYQKGSPVTIYEKDDKSYLDTYEGDPHISFHEFQLILARIAFEVGFREEGGSHQQQQMQRKNDNEKYIHKFFGQTMYFRKNEQVGLVQLPPINRKLIKNIVKYTQILLQEVSDEEDDHLDPIDNIEEDPITQIAIKQQEMFFNQPLQTFDLDQIIKQLDKELPPIPALPQVEKEQEKWDPEKRKVIGPPPPPPPQDKNKPKPAKPKQKPRRKAGEPEPRKIIFEDIDKKDPKYSEQYLQEWSDKLQHETKLLSNVERGTMSDIQVIPVLIQELLYPPNPPLLVRTLIEAAINAHNEANFMFSIQNYEDAKKVWQQIEGRDLPDSLELFFEFQKGCVYESAGRDDFALSCFITAKNIANKLPLSSPDRALPYCGLGMVLYNTEEYEWALRCYLKAREFREQLLGIETVDTASVFNNLGCCMYMLERNKESFAYFKLAHAVLESHLGQYHSRTLTAARNMQKSNKNHYENVPEFKKLWVTYVQDQFVAKKKKKKKSKK